MLGKHKKQKRENIDIFNNTPDEMDLLLPDELQEKKDYLILGYNKYSRIFVMTVYPEQTWISWLDDLFNIGNINISVKIEPSSNGNVINQLTKKLVQNQSEYATYSKQGNILHLPELEKQICDLEDLRMLIQTNQDKLFFATIFITLNAESLQELNEKTKILEKKKYGFIIAIKKTAFPGKSIIGKEAGGFAEKSISEVIFCFFYKESSYFYVSYSGNKFTGIKSIHYN